MNRKILSLIILLLFPSLVFAHSGRLDGSGGHRVNKPYEYDGRYIVVKDGIKYYQVGKILFKEGDYHFHCRPDLNGFKDGIYIPTADNLVNTMTTAELNMTEDSLIASKNSNLYHAQNCKYIKNIKEENTIIFTDIEDAENSGYLPHYCIEGER